MVGGLNRAGRWAGRFFARVLPAEGQTLELGSGEGHHAGASRRARRGDTLTLFDGSGWDAECGVLEASGGRVVVEALAKRFGGPPSPRHSSPKNKEENFHHRGTEAQRNHVPLVARPPVRRAGSYPASKRIAVCHCRTRT